MRLEKQVQVAARFQRSVRIDTDLNSPGALDGFLCTHSFARALNTVAENLRANGHGAYTWTGPYGGGKSVLAVALAHLLGPRGRQRSAAECAVGGRVAKDVIAAFKPGSRGRITLPIVGARAPAHAMVWDALRTARLIQAKPGQRQPAARDVMQAVIRVSQREAHSGLLIVIDELGRILEGAASAQGDLHFLQDLAEVASRSNGRLIVLGILHQAFEEYAARLGKQARDEWVKVQGRFIDIPLSPSSNEQLELLARAITASGAPKSHRELAGQVARAIRKYRPDASSDMAATLMRCWPLHPVTACLLGPISRRRFGQNQRSLFAFLNSREPAGFQDFLRDASTDRLFDPEQLFDYLQLNLEPAILASPDGHRWSMAIDALERAEKRSAGKLELALLKSIALLDLFRERSGLYASKQILDSLFSGTSRSMIDRALEQMRQWSVVTYREHLGAYAIYAGSDFDLQAALDEAKERVTEPDLKAVRQLANLRPIVAKRHYHETGAFRWFEVDVVSSAELPQRTHQFIPNGAIGQILVVIPGPQDSERSLRVLAEDVTAKVEHPCLVGVCVAGGRTGELTMELLQLEQIRSHHPQLRDDTVARREVDARSATAAHLLEGEIRNAFAAAHFYYKGQRTKIQGVSDLSRYASNLADVVYRDSPRIFNELLNRGAPSSNAVAAQKCLLKAMVLRAESQHLAFEGYPPERGLYDSILSTTVLHVFENGRATFRVPNRKDLSRLRPLWKATDDFLERAARAPVSAADIFKFFSAPPFGIRSGLLPILLVAYLQSRSDRYTIYVDNVLESALSEFGVDRLVMDPSSISLRVFDPNARQKQLIDGVRATLARVTRDASILELADTTMLARALVSLVRSQPPFVLRTMRMSQRALAIRSALRAASDPHVLLHETLPSTLERLLGKERPPLQEELSVLDAALEEIATAYNHMLHRIDERFRVELGVAESPIGDEELRARAERIRELSGDLRLEAFAARLASYRSELNAIEGIASLAVNKASRDWTDNDVDAALLEVAALAQRFNRAEAFARVKGRPDGRHAISIVVGLDRAPVIVSRDFEITERDRKLVLEIARRMSSVGKGARPEILLAALAQVGCDLITAESDSSSKAVSG
jgi:hypothetical protein